MYFNLHLHCSLFTFPAYTTQSRQLFSQDYTKLVTALISFTFLQLCQRNTFHLLKYQVDFLSNLEKTSHLSVQTCHLMARSQRTASKLHDRAVRVGKETRRGMSSTLPAPNSQHGLICTAPRYSRARGRDRVSKTISVHCPSQKLAVTTYSPSQMAWPLASLAFGKPSALRASLKHPKLRSDRCLQNHSVMYGKDQRREHLTVTSTLAPKTGSENFMHLAMTGEIQAAIYLKDSTRQLTLIAVLNDWFLFIFSCHKGYSKFYQTLQRKKKKCIKLFTQHQPVQTKYSYLHKNKRIS